MSQICKICNLEKKFSEYFFRNDSKKYRKDCKKCIGDKKYKLKNQYKENNINKKHNLSILKKCSLCLKQKELSYFSKKNDSKSGFYSWCLECSRLKDKKREKIRVNYSYTDTKICNKCNTEKTVLDNYYQKLGSKDGFKNTCKQCVSELRKLQAKDLYLKKKHKLDTNIQYKLAENIRTRIRQIIGNIYVLV